MLNNSANKTTLEQLQRPIFASGSPVLSIVVPVVQSMISTIQLFVTPWTIACQAPLSLRFLRQEYWSGCHFLLQGIFPTLRLCLGPVSFAFQAGSLPLKHLGIHVLSTTSRIIFSQEKKRQPSELMRLGQPLNSR